MSSALEFLSTPARQASVFGETQNRPWPIPDSRWVMAQTWDDLLFAHWRVDRDALRALVPEGLELDEFDGSAWLGITPFVVTGFRIRGTFPVPGLSTFPEINVRTYVTADDKPGIWFFSLDTSSPLAVEGARRAYRLPYYHARMTVGHRAGWIDYSTERRDRNARPFVFSGRYQPTGNVFNAEPGSLEYFLTERYCLYAKDARGLHRAEIQHPPWPLQQAEAEIELNSMPPDGIELPHDEPLLHFARRQDVLIWSLERIVSSS